MENKIYLLNLRNTVLLILCIAYPVAGGAIACLLWVLSDANSLTPGEKGANFPLSQGSDEHTIFTGLRPCGHDG
jgi:hypothetical protein